MTRFEFGMTDEATRLRRARDTVTDRAVVIEASLRSDRLRQLQSIPRCTSIAPFERNRDGHRLELIHPAPLEFVAPVDEFDVAQAIGSMLDGLAWLHAHGAVHGAVTAMSLTDGPTGGRLSLAGAFGSDTSATPADDVYAASALAFRLLVGDAAGPDAHSDARLARSATPAVKNAVGAGLDPNPLRRPDAAVLATMVRGEFLPPIVDGEPREPLLARLQATMSQLLRERSGAVVGIGAAVLMVVFAAALATADRADPPPMALTYSLADEPAAADPPTTGRRHVPATTSTTAPAVVVTTPPDRDTAETPPAPAPVVVLAGSATRANDSPPGTLAPAAAPPPTTAAPAPVAPPTTVPTTIPPPTTAAPTTIPPPTTKPPPPAKPKKDRGDRSQDDASVLGGLATLLSSLFS